MRFSSLAVLLLLATPIHADDWPEWLGAKRDAIWRETGILDKFPVGGPKILWRHPLGPGYAGPVIADDRVVVLDRPTSAGAKIKDAFAKTAVPGKERVLCLDAATGKPIWQHEYDCPYEKLSYPNGPRTSSLIRDGKVYALGAMGDLFCLDSKNGNVHWQKNLPKEYKTEHPVWGYAAHPYLDGNKLILLVGGDGSAVVALDKDTGKELWKALTSEEVCYSPPMITEAGGKRQLIVWLSEALYSLDPETGKQYWLAGYPEDAKPTRPAVNIAQPLRIGDMLFVSSFYHGALAMTLGRDNPTAAVAYRSKEKSPEKATGLHALMATPATRDGFIYGTGMTGDLRCIEAASGNPMWASKKPFGDKDAIFGTIFFTAHDDRFFLLTDRGDLIVARLSPKGYEEIDRAKVIEPSQSARGREVVWCQPAFARRCMYVRNDKEIICVSLAK